MKILTINVYDSGGGAAIAAINLATELSKALEKLNFCVLEKKTSLTFVSEIETSKLSLIGKFWKKINCFTKSKWFTTNPILHSENSKSKIPIELINNSNADIVHLHWINHDMISIEDIARIKIPIVWTLHDSWAFCGAEHHPNVLENDKRYIEGYLKKNKPSSTKGKDICRTTWERKRKSWKNQKFVFISPSVWLKNRLQESYLFKNAECYVIPNIVPQNIFYKRTRQVCREALGFEKSKKIIGFGAADDITDKNSIKGGKQLIEALNKLKLLEDVQLLVFGPVSEGFAKLINIDTIYTGYIQSPQILAAIYGALDVFVCPSLIENLPTTCIEAQLCGVPVVAFNVGGIPEIVEHKVTGYLAKPYDTDDLADGIEYCIDNAAELGKKAEILCKKKYDTDSIIKKHLEVYQKALNITLPE